MDLHNQDLLSQFIHHYFLVVHRSISSESGSIGIAIALDGYPGGPARQRRPDQVSSREEKRSRERKPTPAEPRPPSSLGHVVVHIHNAGGSTRRGEEMRWIKEKSQQRWWWCLPTCAGDADRCHPQVGGSPVRAPPPLPRRIFCAVLSCDPLDGWMDVAGQPN